MEYTAAILACGCKIQHMDGDWATVKITYCPLHKAAPDLYEALKDFGLYVAVNYDDDNKPYYYIDQEWMDKRTKALAKAEQK